MMRSLLVLILPLLCLPPFNLDAYDGGVWQKNEAAVALLNQQQFEQALTLLIEADRESPDNKVIRANIAMGYLGAGQQQIQAGGYGQAAELLQAGKDYNDQESRLWLLRGIALMRNGSHAEAETELNEAWAMIGDEPGVLGQLGQLYYETDRMFEAVDAWQRALQIDSDNEALAAKLEKAKRELQVEKELDRNYSGHFILSYAENREADIGGEILDSLEEAYTWAGAKLGHYPERQTPVILYTQRQFSGLTGSPEWATGLYDGKIRLSIGGLTDVGSKVKALLAHEFMHLMVREMAGNRVPVWLNEGLAEIAAHEQDDPALVHLDAALADEKLFALADLEGNFRAIDPKRIGLAYEQSYSFVRYLVERFGWYQMAELLPLFKNGSSVQDLVRTVYGDYGADLVSLERDWQRQL
jgi:tetratricopeptide (TPR) repeat protein